MIADLCWVEGCSLTKMPLASA